MNKRHIKYWERRTNKLEKARMKKAEDYVRKLEKEYIKTFNAIQKDIEAFYIRYMDENNVSYTEAKKLLNKKDLKMWKVDVEEYIDMAKQYKYTDIYNDELKRLYIKTRVDRLQALQTDIKAKVYNLYYQYNLETTDLFTDCINDVYYRSIYEIDKFLGVGADFAILNDRVVKDILTYPWSGKDFSSRIHINRDKTVQVLEETLTNGLIRGLSVDNMTKELEKKLNISKRNANTLIRTETNFFLNESSARAYEESTLGKYQVLATLDSRTTPICREQDLKIYNVKDRKVGVNYPPFHINCYDKETEVYTNEGWKFFNELNKNELFYSIDPKTMLPEWLPPINYIQYHYKGDMKQFKNQRFDLLVTPNHNVLVQNMDSKNKARELKLRPAKNISGVSKNRFLCGMKWNGEKIQSIKLGGRDIDVETYLKFMAYYLADESSTPDRKSYNVKIAQRDNDWMYKELKKMPFKIYKCKESIMIRDKQLGKELRKYGKAHKKYIPEIIKNLSPELIRIFLMAYSRTDGTIKKGKKWKGYQFKDSISFFTSSDRMAGDLGELIMKVGGRPSFRIDKVAGKKQEFKNGIYTINHDLWIISWNKQIYSWASNMDVRYIDYNDMVYCVELAKNHTLLVRRNGKVCWCGNCRTTTTPYFDDIEGTRIARDEKGKTYDVPSDMSYKKWYNEHVAPKTEPTGMGDWKKNKKGIIIPTDIIKGHYSPKIKGKPNSVVQYTNKSGQINRNFYDNNGYLVKQIHNGPHGNIKEHPFGKKGEHAHYWKYENGKVVNRDPIELKEDDITSNLDILEWLK